MVYKIEKLFADVDMERYPLKSAAPKMGSTYQSVYKKVSKILILTNLITRTLGNLMFIISIEVFRRVSEFNGRPPNYLGEAIKCQECTSDTFFFRRA